MVTDFKKKQKVGWVKNLSIAAGGVGIVLVVGFLVVADINMYKKRQELSNHIQALEQKIAEVKAKNIQLEQGIAQADNDQYIEKVAREELDMQKPGEKVFSFVKPEDSKAKDNPTPKNPWQNFLAWIGGWFKK